MSLRSRKRARTDPDTVSLAGDCGSRPEVSFTKDDKFWYLDGNIILLAQNIGFKVYKGLLAEQSEVFRDLFTLPQPSEAQSVEDCPTVHLSDTAQDLRALLSVMIHGRKYASVDEAQFEDIAAWVRMSHKYNIQDLLVDAMKRLKQYFPDKFADFKDDPHAVQRQHAIVAVNLARLTDTATMVPPALYYCCTLDSRTLLRGSARSDGTVDCLAPEDLERCIQGKAELAGQAALCLSRICRPTVSSRCATPTACGVTMIRLHDILAIGAQCVGSTDALLTWRRDIERELRDHLELSCICRACRDMMLERDVAERERVWQELPSLFELAVDNWERTACH
ncbi:uncharacterized protein B0H18DRAFT_1137503 [Fomitopsis serialis]|uniref:uncharacterized protein n=1 Tax=Fomitopsis serialis TaxID=139415 RepID=UPI0020085BEE|nr:uncharacterized protein B0H18DRAFT_1137503 [Neoantrodia serialis]KAH9932308.1 hypothetical protein B0H18DRAFT_1137503 [Neoantrodia serialis]